MPDTYGFLRFQVAGVAFFLYWMVFLSPFVSGPTVQEILSDGNRLVAGVGLILILGMPVGYVIHQFIVNRYRGEVHRRESHGVLESIIEDTCPDLLPPKGPGDTKRFEVLDSLLSFFSSVSASDQSYIRTVEEVISKRLNGRWSHLYARLALGTYSILGAVGATVGTLLLSIFLPHDFPWQPVVLLTRGRFEIGPISILVAVLLAVLIYLLVWRMNSYLPKLWTEICDMEYMLIERKREEIQAALKDITDPVKVGADLRSPSIRRKSFLGQFRGRS
ncbi:MAG: hypothetical protein V3U52_01175 [Thermoplasmata archaeon]